MAAIAAPLGRCFTAEPELLEKLKTLLKTEDKQRHSELSNTTDAMIIEATLALRLHGRECAYAKEIADKANHLLGARGETVRLRPEHVGHSLKGLGLRTRRLSQAGNGLTFDKATVAQIHELAEMYMLDGMEDTPEEAENLHSSQATENKHVE